MRQGNCILVESGFEPCNILKLAPFNETPRFTKWGGIWWLVTWRSNKKKHANSSQARSKRIWKRKLKHLHRVLAVHPQHEHFITEIYEPYTNRTSIQHRSLIYHLFNLILLIAKEPIQRSFTIKDSNQHIFFKTQWNCTIQVSTCSATADLSNA